MDISSTQFGAANRFHIALVDAFRAHWKKHNDQKPKLLILTRDQDRMLDRYRHPKHSPSGEYWGVPIEIDPNSPGVMIAIDAAEMPLADYARG